MRIFFRVAKFIFCGVIVVLMVACGDSTATGLKSTPLAVEGKKISLLNVDIKDARVLVFSKTKGWRHDSIPAGLTALQTMATDNFFTLVATEDAEYFTDAQLSTFNTIIFLNTSLDVLNDDQQIAMERFIQAGGGFVGIHAAADTEWEGDWYWYRKLVGAVFKNHPNQPSNVQTAKVNLVDALFMGDDAVPSSVEIADEWYNYTDFYEFNKVLLTVDEKSYHGGEHGQYHPIAWSHEFDGGRSFYTGLGHTAEVYSNPYFLAVLLKGLKYAVGGKQKLDYSKSRPESNRFIKKVLIDNLNEPINLSFFANGDALIAERAGIVKLIDYKTGAMREVGNISVNYQNFLEMGLLGLAIDPAFARTQFIYAALNVEKEGEYFQRLARFKWIDGKINEASQQVLLEYPINKNCCHTAGDLEFGKDGELFMSTGDNTNPHDQNGYAPIDFRADYEKNDALRGAGNTQDLRGKVIRIKPLEAGGYDIPKGNLFTNPKEGRPEIYVMGARNPYKIAYDKNSSALFFGDVGPDAGENSTLQGSRGYDEVNRVLRAGNFGWPLFIGNNYAYADYNFTTHQSEKMFNPLAPLNNSPRNVGLKQLPPAQRPLLWYPYGASENFPELGQGGRTALVADVYHSEDYPANEHRYPAYYNKKLFIADFMRNWIKAVSFDDFGRILKIEPFAPQIPYVLPIDARFAPDGTLYVLEYGSAWFKANPDSRLSRIEFSGTGNRPPEAKISIDRAQGAAPFAADANAQSSVDLDGDNLTFAWSLKPKNVKGEAVALGNKETQKINIAEPGEYILTLLAKDPLGATASVETQLQVGNEPAKIDLSIEGNQSFYWPLTKSLKYTVAIMDKEDGLVTGSRQENSDVAITFALQKSNDGAPAEGHQTADVETVAQNLMRENGCKSCHSVDTKIVGPAFKEVAARYKNDKNALKYLTNKIAKGGNGAWGELNMPAFATLSENDRAVMAAYILLMSTIKKSMPLQGELSLIPDSYFQKIFDTAEEPKSFTEKKYEFNAAYTDKGGAGIGPITAKKSLVLLPARFALRSDIVSVSPLGKLIVEDKHAKRETFKIPATGNWLTLRLGQYDLSNIDAVRLGGWVTKQSLAWQFEVRLGSDTGTVLASGELAGNVLETYSRLLLKLQAQTGFQDIYLAIRSSEKSNGELHLLDISFHK
ncbi:MAG: ThuA domain-containing protein [Pseudomonadota bacterium]